MSSSKSSTLLTWVLESFAALSKIVSSVDRKGSFQSGLSGRRIIYFNPSNRPRSATAATPRGESNNSRTPSATRGANDLASSARSSTMALAPKGVRPPTSAFHGCSTSRNTSAPAAAVPTSPSSRAFSLSRAFASAGLVVKWIHLAAMSSRSLKLLGVQNTSHGTAVRALFNKLPMNQGCSAPQPSPLLFLKSDNFRGSAKLVVSEIH